MAEYALLTFRASDGGARAGLRVGDRVADLTAAGPLSGVDCESTLSILHDWDNAEPVLAALAEDIEAGRAPAAISRPLDQTRLMAPLLYPGAIFCAAANYTDHMKEMTGREPPDKAVTRPYFFLKSASHCVIGPEDPIRLPKISEQVDWEAEIGVVIGRNARNVGVDDALDHVAGYTIVNDLSLRDHMARKDWNFGSDWMSQKTFDGAAPMGPWITPRAAIADPHDLAIRLWVNDDLMQDSSSRLMHFDIAEQIAWLSERLTLRPGDVIATGTPSGVGKPRGIFLKAGDEVTIEIEGLGRLHNPVVNGD